MKLTEQQKQELCDFLEESLNRVTLKGLILEDETGGLPLVDYLSYEGGTILKGKEEINNIVEQIFFEMDTLELPNDHQPASLESLIDRVERLKWDASPEPTTYDIYHNAAIDTVLDILRATPCISAKALRKKGTGEWYYYNELRSSLFFHPITDIPSDAELVDIQILVI